MVNIKRTCNKDDINILARACVCVCARVRVRACVCMKRERQRETEASVPRKAALSVFHTATAGERG